MKRKTAWIWTIGLIFFGIAGLTACLGSPSSSTTVTVTLTDYKIQSSVTTFTVGDAYHFVISNQGKVVHDFMIMPPPSQTRNMSTDQLNKVALAMTPSLQPGQTGTLDFTFSHNNVMSYSTGMDMRGFEFACHLPGQYERGMRLPISIIPA